MPTARNKTKTGTPSRAENLLDAIPRSNSSPVNRIRVSTRNIPAFSTRVFRSHVILGQGLSLPTARRVSPQKGGHKSPAGIFRPTPAKNDRQSCSAIHLICLGLIQGSVMGFRNGAGQRRRTSLLTGTRKMKCHEVASSPIRRHRQHLCPV